MPLDRNSEKYYKPKYTKKSDYLSMAMSEPEVEHVTESVSLNYPKVDALPDQERTTSILIESEALNYPKAEALPELDKSSSSPTESESLGAPPEQEKAAPISLNRLVPPEEYKHARVSAINSDEVPGPSQATVLHEPSGPSSNSSVKERRFSWNSYITAKWCATSRHILETSENGILACLNTNYTRRYVHINNNDTFGNQEIKIWTLSMNENSPEVPILLVHGFASGLALWALNFEALAKDRPVYAIDLPGFAQSSRPKFRETPAEAEEQYVQAIEAWRAQMNLSSLILLGHSMGGFLCTAYTIQYPERVQHLILADPWGFQEKPEEYKGVGRLPYPLFTIMRFLEPFSVNPLWSLRLLGRMGPHVIQYLRSELIKSFKPEVQDAEKLVSNYICQCNTREPTGEAAFTLLMKSLGWAKNPMINRIHLLQYDLPLTLIYGGNSWIDHVPLEILQTKRGISTLIDLHILEGTGHQVYTNKSTLNLFNKIVVHACQKLRSPHSIINMFIRENQEKESLHLQTTNWEHQSDRTIINDENTMTMNIPCACPLTDMDIGEELYDFDYVMEMEEEYEFEVDMEDKNDSGSGHSL